MKVAISSEGPDLESSVSRRFGVSRYLLIVDLESGTLEVVPNPGSAAQRTQALATKVGCCIIDHHLLRCNNGVKWLDALQAETERGIWCAADFMNRRRRFLEAQRAELYDRMPVPEDWYERYAKGLADTSEFLARTEV